MIINAGEKSADCYRPRAEHLPARRRVRRERKVSGTAGSGDENSVEQQRPRVPGTHPVKPLIVMRLVRAEKVLPRDHAPDDRQQRVSDERKKHENRKPAWPRVCADAREPECRG